MPVRLELKPTRNWGTDKRVQSPEKTLILFPSVVSLTTDKKQSDGTKINNLSKLFPSLVANTDMTFMAKPNYKIDDTFGMFCEA